jgi:GNAT superfamily N-acetyltransferase
MSKFVTLWFWKGARLSAEWFKVESYGTNEHPHPTLVVGLHKPTSAEPFSWSSLDANNRLVVGLDHSHLPNTPALWHVLVREYQRDVPSQSLISFVSEDFPDGTVIEFDEFKRRGFSFGDRVSAIRWGFGDPKIEQLYVDEKFRRMRIGTKVINCADLINVAGGWGGFIYGGDQVTQMGEQIASSWTGSARLVKKEVSLPPMN